jgi:hypothetical protein
MLDATLPLISGWQNFYLIVGPSAAALLGLQFVVVALVKDAPIPTSPSGVNGFTTPTIVHFATVLSIAAVLSAPWRSLHSPALVIGVGSVLLAIYVLVVARRIAHMTGYTPVAEDWVWHVVVPLVVYAALIVSALELEAHVETVLFVIAGASMVLLFDGIHNAWDIATYIALQVGSRAERGGSEGAPGGSAPERESALTE